MQSPADILRSLGGPSRVAGALGISNPSTVIKWGLRGSIPAKHWPGLIDLAAREKIRLNADALMRAHQQSAA